MLAPESTPDKGTAFPFGLRLFFRTSDNNGVPHFMNLPTARTVVRKYEEELFVAIQDEKERYLIFFNLDAITCLIPLDAEGKIE